MFSLTRGRPATGHSRSICNWSMSKARGASVQGAVATSVLMMAARFPFILPTVTLTSLRGKRLAVKFKRRRAVGALSGICFTRACLYQPLSPTVVYKMDACAFWCPYPGGNNGKSLLRKAAFRRLLSKALRPRPHAPPPYPPLQCWDEVFLLSGDAWQTHPPTLEWGMGGRGMPDD